MTLLVQFTDTMNGFRYISYAQEVIFAPASLAQLGETVGRFGWHKVLLCTSHSMKINGQIDSIKSMLGNSLVAVFDHVQPHVQDVQVKEVLALAIKNKADAVIGMGGGSPIGMAKAVGFQSHLPIIAIPSTYAGSEMTPVYGMTHTDENPPRKVTVNDPKIAPKLVIYDPQLTLDLPPELSASTGINALAHCIEALYSKTRNPISTAAAINGVRHINHALLNCYQDGNNLDARTEMLLGAHLAGLSLASVLMGLHHGLCHVLGGSANIPHGITNSIILPHAIRFNAAATAPQLLTAAEAMGIPVNGSSPQVVIEALAQKIHVLIGRMNLPQRLRDAGTALKESDLPDLAQLGFQNRNIQNNPTPITNASQIENLLRDAW
jgi:maleylacetate reductase